MLVLDPSDAVRAAFARVLRGWMTELPDRFEWWSRLLPYVLSGCSDEAPAVSALALGTLDACGAAHETEHAQVVIQAMQVRQEEAQAALRLSHVPHTSSSIAAQYGVDGTPGIDYDRPLPPPLPRGRPRLGARLFIRAHARRFLTPILKELHDYAPCGVGGGRAGGVGSAGGGATAAAARARAASLLCLVLAHFEEHITQDVHLLVPALVRCIHDYGAGGDAAARPTSGATSAGGAASADAGDAATLSLPVAAREAAAAVSAAMGGAAAASGDAADVGLDGVHLAEVWATPATAAGSGGGAAADFPLHAWIQAAARLVGRFVDPAAWLPLLLPLTRGDVALLVADGGGGVAGASLTAPGAEARVAAASLHVLTLALSEARPTAVLPHAPAIADALGSSEALALAAAVAAPLTPAAAAAMLSSRESSIAAAVASGESDTQYEGGDASDAAPDDAVDGVAAATAAGASAAAMAAASAGRRGVALDVAFSSERARVRRELLCAVLALAAGVLRGRLSGLAGAAFAASGRMADPRATLRPLVRAVLVLRGQMAADAESGAGDAFGSVRGRRVAGAAAAARGGDAWSWWPDAVAALAASQPADARAWRMLEPSPGTSAVPAGALADAALCALAEAAELASRTLPLPGFAPRSGGVCETPAPPLPALCLPLLLSDTYGGVPLLRGPACLASSAGRGAGEEAVAAVRAPDRTSPQAALLSQLAAAATAGSGDAGGLLEALLSDVVAGMGSRLPPSPGTDALPQAVEAWGQVALQWAATAAPALAAAGAAQSRESPSSSQAAHPAAAAAASVLATLARSDAWWGPRTAPLSSRHGLPLVASLLARHAGCIAARQGASDAKESKSAAPARVSQQTLATVAGAASRAAATAASANPAAGASSAPSAALNLLMLALEALRGAEACLLALPAGDPQGCSPLPDAAAAPPSSPPATPWAIVAPAAEGASASLSLLAAAAATRPILATPDATTRAAWGAARAACSVLEAAWGWATAAEEAGQSATVAVSCDELVPLLRLCAKWGGPSPEAEASGEVEESGVAAEHGEMAVTTLSTSGGGEHSAPASAFGGVGDRLLGLAYTLAARSPEGALESLRCASLLDQPDASDAASTVGVPLACPQLTCSSTSPPVAGGLAEPQGTSEQSQLRELAAAISEHCQLVLALRGQAS